MSSSSPRSIKQTAIRGALWTVLSFGIQYALRLGSNILLTRLLPPTAFGLMQLSSSVLIGFGMLSDTGVGPNIIQSNRGEDPTFLNTARTIQIIRGILIFLGCAIVAVPAARFYGQPEVLGLIMLGGLNMFIIGFENMSSYLLNRDLRIRERETFALAEQVISMVAMLIWAMISPTVWALATGYVLSPLIRLVWTHYLVPGAPKAKIEWDQKSAQEILSFGKWIFFSTAATFFAIQADRLILGKMVGFELLGIYGIALTFAELPRQVVGRISAQILLPAIARIADRPRAELREKLLRNRYKVLLFAVLCLTPLICFGDFLIRFLYRGNYQTADWMLPILALGIWPNLLHESTRQALVAIGKPKYEAYGQFFKGLFVCSCIPLGIHYFGMLGAVIAVACNDLPLYSAVSHGLRQEGLNNVKQDLLMTGLLLGLLAMILFARYIFGGGTPIDGLLVFPR